MQTDQGFPITSRYAAGSGSSGTSCVVKVVMSNTHIFIYYKKIGIIYAQNQLPM
jgi:hypothetical protein